MAIKDTNKQFNVTISKEDHERLKKIAKSENRSVSKQALHFILDGLNLPEKKRD